MMFLPLVLRLVLGQFFDWHIMQSPVAVDRIGEIGWSRFINENYL